MSVFTQFTGGGIKSIQRGTVSIGVNATTGTATISSVDTNKAVLYYLGFTMGGGDGSGATVPYFPRITLTDSTTVTATRNSSTSASSANSTVSYQVVEYY